jgi:hypothetical protein
LWRSLYSQSDQAQKNLEDSLELTFFVMSINILWLLRIPRLSLSVLSLVCSVLQMPTSSKKSKDHSSLKFIYIYIYIYCTKTDLRLIPVHLLICWRIMKWATEEEENDSQGKRTVQVVILDMSSKWLQDKSMMCSS